MPGIDIAKMKFNACLINLSGKLRHKVFLHTSTGYEQLRDWLSKQGVEQVHACLEATGTYGEALVEMRVMEENRLSSGITADSVRQSVEVHTAYLNEQIKRTEELIRQHINSNPTLKQQSELLDSIPGIAEATAALLLSEIMDITQYRSARQVAAYAGLVPRERQSGSSVRGRTRLSKIGNARLRRAL